MISIEFTLEEIEIIQNVLNFVQGFKLISSSLFESKNDAMTGLENKIAAFIGNPCDRIKRIKIEAGIREYFKDDPEEMAYVLKNLDADFSLAPAYQQ